MGLGTLIQTFWNRDGVADFLRRTKWLPEPEIPDYSKDFYKHVVVYGLEPDELRRSGLLLGTQLHSVNVEFKSRNGIKYQAVHYLRDSEHGPHVHLYSYINQMVSDWNEVEQAIDGIVNGARQKLKQSRNDEVRASPVSRIPMPKRLTAEGIARYLEAYKNHFEEVKAVALFEHVPKSVFRYKNFPTLPQERVRLEGY